jgi:hypothetical protein
MFLFRTLKRPITVAKATLKRGLALRYMKCLDDRFQLKFREGKTKRKKPPHF